MKKLLSLALTVCLAATLVLPAMAADAGLDSRLAKVTLSVKQTLDIGDEFPEFSGQLTETDPAPLWHLIWKNDHSMIEVTATESGKVVSYYVNDDKNTYVTSNGDLKKFPKLSRTQAEKIAQSFLSKALDKQIETAVLEEGTNRLAIYDDGNYNFYGELRLYGLKTPTYVNLTVNSAKKTVTSFYRGDGGKDYASFPSTAKITKDAAAATLFGTVKMQLSYVVSEKDPNKAILRYLPESKADYVVDAQTGTLLELLSPILYREGNYATADSAAKGSGGLTDVETQATSDLKGALSSRDLEAAARNISELKISSDYKLSNIYYYTEEKDSKDQSKPTTIYANVTFDKQNSTAKMATYSYAEKSVMLNAKTGAFVSSSAYASSNETTNTNYNRAQCEAVARAFAEKYNPNELKETALAALLSETTDRYQTFSFVRQVNGILFPENAIWITVDGTDGSIGSYSVSWSNQMDFATSSGIKTAQEAKDIFTNAAGIGLCYAEVSTGKDTSEMKLVYDYVDQTIWGVDAASGTLLKSQNDAAPSIAYGDISGHFAQKQIEALSEYGIGYLGDSFAPNQALNQKDALTLIISASGYSLDQSAEDYEESLYAAAYSMGLLEKTERKPVAAVTRAQLTKLIVDAAGYGEVAKLKNIYRIGFKDEKAIHEDLFGYVAIAKGLGIIKGDVTGNFAPNNTATRAQLAIMLYNIMSR